MALNLLNILPEMSSHIVYYACDRLLSFPASLDVASWQYPPQQTILCGRTSLAGRVRAAVRLVLVLRRVSRALAAATWLPDLEGIFSSFVVSIVETLGIDWADFTEPCFLLLAPGDAPLIKKRVMMYSFRLVDYTHQYFYHMFHLQEDGSIEVYPSTTAIAYALGITGFESHRTIVERLYNACRSRALDGFPLGICYIGKSNLSSHTRVFFHTLSKEDIAACDPTETLTRLHLWESMPASTEALTNVDVMQACFLDKRAAQCETLSHTEIVADVMAFLAHKDPRIILRDHDAEKAAVIYTAGLHARALGRALDPVAQ